MNKNMMIAILNDEIDRIRHELDNYGPQISADYDEWDIINTFENCIKMMEGESK